MPLLPVVHDDLSLRCELHASRRPRAPLDRKESSPSMERAVAAGGSRRGPVTALVFPRVAVVRSNVEAVGSLSPRPLGSIIRSGSRFGRAGLADKSARRP